VSRRLERSRTNRVIAGVCGGLGDYLDIDATFVRVAIIVLTLVGGVGILVYIVLLVLMPLPGEAPMFGLSTGGVASGDTATTTRTVVDPESAERRRYAVGILLVAVGAIFFLGNLGVFRGLDWKYIWPVAIIALGVFLIAQRTRR
jgi:phage shock protein PspC (stress-responsive transcriptional regulator)